MPQCNTTLEWRKSYEGRRVFLPPDLFANRQEGCCVVEGLQECLTELFRIRVPQRQILLSQREIPARERVFFKGKIRVGSISHGWKEFFFKAPYKIMMKDGRFRAKSQYNGT